MYNNEPLNITSCLVRFFLNKEPLCHKEYYFDEAPIIPRVGETVSMCDNDWQPCKVKEVLYSYPENNDGGLMIDIKAEDCEYEMFEDDEENW